MTTIQQMFFATANSFEGFPFSSFTFTNGGATGRNGPTSFASVSGYTSQSWYSTYFSVSFGIQYWTAPATGSYTITAAGAAGHGGIFVNKCRGIIINSTVTLTQGVQYKILVGQMGTVYTGGSGGGGGGTFMTTTGNSPIIVAGGGGGSINYNSTFDTTVYFRSDGQFESYGEYSNDGSGSGGSGGYGGTGSANGWGSGGGGFFGNGTAAANAAGYGYSGLGLSFLNGGTGGNTATSAFGGFGGGAGTHGNTGGGGGGGGYSGGGGSNQNFIDSTAGGGGSYGVNAITNAGYNKGHGYITITKV